MFKRNPDAVALALIVFFLMVPAVQPARPMVNPRADVKIQLKRTVASLKQCLHLRTAQRPIQRPL